MRTIVFNMKKLKGDITRQSKMAYKGQRFNLSTHNPTMIWIRLQLMAMSTEIYNIHEAIRWYSALSERQAPFYLGKGVRENLEALQEIASTPKQFVRWYDNLPMKAWEAGEIARGMLEGRI